MKIPASSIERLEFVREVIGICVASRETRQAAYRTLKQYLLYGQESGTSIDQNVFGVINKIGPQVDKVCSMLYSADSTRFAVDIGRNVPRVELAKVPALNDAVMDRWHASEGDTRYDEALYWAHCYGSMFLKARPQKQDLTIDIVEPHHVGVYREDIMGLPNQEAFYHEYRMPKPQLRRMLEISGLTSIDSIVDAAIENVGELEGSVTRPIDRIVTSSALPNAQGEINTYIGSRVSYVPIVKQPMVRMYELYVWDDDLEDYRVFTCAHPDIPIFDRQIGTMFIEDELPIIQVCPFPMYGYFWGISAVERVLNLQMIRNTRWDQVQHIMELEANPPKVATGDFMASVDELQAAMDSPGGVATSATQGADLKAVAPTRPEDLFAEVNYIDTQFDDAMGTTDIMAGKGEAGVRSEGHASQLMRSGSSRLKKRALIIERQLEELATLILQIMRKYSDRTYETEPDGKGQSIQFTAAQFTDDFVVRVDAHSSSPAFQQDMGNLAFALFKAKAIDREELIDMLPVPMKDLLKNRLKTKIEPQEAKAAQQEQKLALVTGKLPKQAGKK